jgi:hypothetical protein
MACSYLPQHILTLDICCCCCLLQSANLKSIQDIFMKKLDDDLKAVQNAMQAAEAKFAAAGGQGPKPWLGGAEAAVAALSGVQHLEAKMRAMRFRCGRQHDCQASLQAGWLAGLLLRQCLHERIELGHAFVHAVLASRHGAQ